MGWAGHPGRRRGPLVSGRQVVEMGQETRSVVEAFRVYVPWDSAISAGEWGGDIGRRGTGFPLAGIRLE